MIFVPTAQVRAFFQEINRTLQCTLSLSDDGLVSHFQNDGFPQPIFLGQSTSRQTKNRLESRIPPSFGWAQPSSDMDEQYMTYELMIESAWETAKNKKKKKSSKVKQQLRLDSHRRLVESLRRTQAYLGLRSDKADNTIDDMSWEEKRDAPETPQALNFDKPAPFPFWKEPIFVAADVESNENNHSEITEVGISTLDTLDLVGIPPGADGSHWISKIRSRHLRVKEYGHIINRDFVAGCPAYFDFGTSEWVRENELAAVVETTLQPRPSSSSAVAETRHLVLVGHSIASDIQYLRQAGLRVEHSPAGTIGFRDTVDTVDTVDTAEFFRIMRGEMTPRRLAGLLQEFNMTAWHLHNAGNDARYTMEVLIRMVLDFS
jgi:DNA polymerase III epsilon subunit-like protein